MILPLVLKRWMFNDRARQGRAEVVVKLFTCLLHDLEVVASIQAATDSFSWEAASVLIDLKGIQRSLTIFQLGLCEGSLPRLSHGSFYNMGQHTKHSFSSKWPFWHLTSFMGQKLAEFFFFQPWPLFINYRTNVVASVIRTWIIWVEGKDADHHHGPDSSQEWAKTD